MIKQQLSLGGLAANHTLQNLAGQQESLNSTMVIYEVDGNWYIYGQDMDNCTSMFWLSVVLPL